MLLLIPSHLPDPATPIRTEHPCLREQWPGVGPVGTALNLQPRLCALDWELNPGPFGAQADGLTIEHPGQGCVFFYHKDNGHIRLGSTPLWRGLIVMSLILHAMTLFPNKVPPILRKLELGLQHVFLGGHNSATAPTLCMPLHPTSCFH